MYLLDGMRMGWDEFQAGLLRILSVWMQYDDTGTKVLWVSSSLHTWAEEKPKKYHQKNKTPLIDSMVIVKRFSAWGEGRAIIYTSYGTFLGQ